MQPGDEATTWSAMVARRLDDRPAISASSGTWSGRELQQRATGAARWLDAMGVPAGCSVPALVTTSLDAVALLLAGAGSARPLAPIGPRLATRELAACLAQHDTPVVVAEPAFADAARAAAALSGHRVAVVDRFPAASPSERPLDWAPRADAIATIMHTSGTTGVPKLVPVRQDRLAARVRNSIPLTGMGPSDVYATMSPFQHIAGIGNVLITLAVGGALVGVERFTPDSWQAMAGFGVTAALLVPTMIELLLEQGVLELPALRMLQYGGAPIHPDTLRQLTETLPSVDLVQIYGTTEGSPVTGLTAADHRRAAQGADHLRLSVGRAAPGVEVRIFEPDDAGVGEVVARAPHVHVADDDGWLHTGDLGRIVDGYVYLVGRQGDRIVRGGENVQPLEVEQVLVEHPGVRDAAVIGVADRRLGETIRAFIVPADPAAPVDLEELRRFARDRLAAFKVPADFVVVDDLPRNESGKVLRRLLRAPDES